MKSYAVLALAATALAQSAPEGCDSSAEGTFTISTVNVTSTKRSLSRRQLAGTLQISLEDGILKDQAGRIGYIASNFQFQFDAPVQAGALQQSGFSRCSNGSLGLDSTTVFYQCLSGDFYNLYSQSTGAQCIPIHMQAIKSEGGSGVSQIPDGQPQATTAAPAVSQIPDGQPQATSPGAVVSQISDGQPQAGTPTAVVSQISDGQPQVGTPAATLPVVSQISDGQPQVGTPAATLPVVSQISDGQPQVGTPVATLPVVSQISDGQPQVPLPTGNVTVPVNATRSAPAQFTGAAATGNAATGALFAGLLGLLAML